MRQFAKIVERRLEPLIKDRMEQEPVIVLQGPRTVGKSTLLHSLADALGRQVLDLDDLETRDAVRADPGLFVRGDPPVLIDEFQHVPELLDAIKAELNIDSSPGRFLLTGSTRYAALPSIAQALTGRAHRIAVRPLSQGEIDGTRESFAETLLEDPAALVRPGRSATTREEYVTRIATGGFPMALRRAGARARARWLDDYVELILERDVIDLSRVRQRRQLPRLLQQLASQTGQLLNLSKAARSIEMERSTAEDYAKLLEAVFLISRLPAWGTTLGSRVAAAPKVHVVDSGLAARLLRLTEGKLGAASPVALAQFGHLFETFVVGEVSKQLDWLDEPVTRGHWRTHEGREVDLVVERGDGRVVGVEAKAGSRVGPADLRGLQSLGRKLGSEFLGGVVLYTGAHAHTHPGRIHVLPLDRLWAPHR